MRPLLSLCLLSLAPLMAAPLAAADTSPAAVPAGRYVVDREHKKLIWSVDHMGFSNFYGRFTDFQATAMLDPKRPGANSVEVTINMNSVESDTAKLDGELKGAQWFDAAKFPTATFKSTRVTPGAAGHAKVAGNLTLHGVTKPVTLDVVFHGGGMHPMMKVETVGFDATTTIKRSDFGVSTFVPMVSDNVKLMIAAEFHLEK